MNKYVRAAILVGLFALVTLPLMGVIGCQATKVSAPVQFQEGFPGFVSPEAIDYEDSAQEREQVAELVEGLFAQWDGDIQEAAEFSMMLQSVGSGLLSQLTESTGLLGGLGAASGLLGIFGTYFMGRKSGVKVTQTEEQKRRAAEIQAAVSQALNGVFSDLNEEKESSYNKGMEVATALLMTSLPGVDNGSVSSEGSA